MEGVCGGPQWNHPVPSFFPSTGTVKASLILFHASHLAQSVKNLSAMQKTPVQFPGQEDPREKEMETHSSILAWEIPWTEEPGGVHTMQS